MAGDAKRADRRVSRDPFAREELWSRPVSGTCDWCGQADAKGRVKEFYVERDSISGRKDPIKGKFCSRDCMNAYHGTSAKSEGSIVRQAQKAKDPSAAPQMAPEPQAQAAAPEAHAAEPKVSAQPGAQARPEAPVAPQKNPNLIRMEEVKSLISKFDAGQLDDKDVSVESKGGNNGAPVVFTITVKDRPQSKLVEKARAKWSRVAVAAQVDREVALESFSEEFLSSMGLKQKEA